MCNTLIYEGRNGQYSEGVKTFEMRLRKACKMLHSTLADSQEESSLLDEGQRELKRIDLLAAMQSNAQIAKNPDDLVVKGIEGTNMRGFVIARVLILGQYIALFEGTRKSTQESLSTTREWCDELKILSSFFTCFNECNHKITDNFFQDQNEFMRKGIISQVQLDRISVAHQKYMTSEQKEEF